MLIYAYVCIYAFLMYKHTKTIPDNNQGYINKKAFFVYKSIKKHFIFKQKNKI